MKYLGVDYGTKKIGIALSDDSGSLAFPLTTIRTGQHALGELIELINRNEVGAVVIGESLNNQGEPNPVMEDIEQFKKDLEGLAMLPVEYEREFMTSSMASRQFAPEAKSRKAHPDQSKLDASAAALILQSYLDRRGKVQ